jgi:hypothetical protein
MGAPWRDFPCLATLILGAAIALGCAEGGGEGGGGDVDAGMRPRDGGRRPDGAMTARDSGFVLRTDAGARRDAGIRRDAGGGPRDSGFFPMPDGGGMMGGLCATTADCAAMPGTCCFAFGPMGFCVPGMMKGPFCVPE